MNKKNNKGFSLVELIVVVAIMAVLVGVLAPSLLRYVEKTRLQKDNSAIAEVMEATKIALSEEAIYTATSDGQTVTITVVAAGTTTFGGTASDLKDEVEATIGTLSFTSNTYKTANVLTITVTKTTDGATAAIASSVDAVNTALEAANLK